ncbi:MAG: hypothetical protein RLY87_2320 [Chloroflexota bacterium]
MEKLFLPQLRLRITLCIILTLCVSIYAQSLRTTEAADSNLIVIGRSLQGRPIEAYRFGNGTRKFVVVGATHGAPERNTQQLSRMLIDWYRQHPNEVPASVRLYIIPLLNPDGDALDLRQNANGVDLNRNMNTTLDACPENDWNTTVFGAGGVVSDTGGPYADSEPESRVIRSFLLDASAVVFIHSDAGLVFPPSCEDPVSIAFAQAYAAGAGYEYARYWDKYHITGGMHDWARGIDLPAIVPELLTGEEPEFEQNLAGLRAVFHNTDALIPALGIRTVNEVPMPLPIWRFWKAYGAESLGLPLTTAQVTDGVYIQDFTTAQIRYDSTVDHQAVSVLPITPFAVSGVAVDIINPDAIITNPENPYTVHDAFARYYMRTDGEELLGAPLSDELMMQTATEPTTIQAFEKGVLRYDSVTNRIIRLPVVWESVAKTNLTARDLPFQLR